jgi:hypothetical protein
MARVKREYFYVDVIERVLGGVHVTPGTEPGSRRSHAERTRQSWVRGRSVTHPARSNANDKRRDPK